MVKGDGMDFIIRKMKKKDIAQVQDVAWKTWHATYAEIIPLQIQDKFLESAYSNKMMKSRLRKTHVFVAEVDRKVVGFANYSPVSNEGNLELAALYLYPDYQGRGIGTALLNAGIKQLTNVKKVTLSVEKNNQIGAAFYKAKGFAVTEEYDDDLSGHMLKTVRMALILGDSPPH
jgi:ribosomal protein S18 acetylase RimI-like enzyme